MRDPYSILGVSKTASADEIQRAYRRLAKTHHPDLNPGDKVAEEKFKEITAAHELLGDADRRARFDAGEIGADGTERPEHRFYRDFSARQARGAGGNYQGYSGFDEAVADLFRAEGRGGMRGMRGDVRYSLSVSFLEAAAGAKKTVTMPDGRGLKVAIPAGVREGQTLRLKGQGRTGFPAGKPGDALVEVHIEPHKLFERRGDDIHIDVPISLPEAVLGAKIVVPTVTGGVTMTVPKGANTGQTLRLKGRGVPQSPTPKGQAKNAARGDQYVRLVVTLPNKPDADLSRLVEDWAADHAYNPRQGPDWR